MRDGLDWTGLIPASREQQLSGDLTTTDARSGTHAYATHGPACVVVPVGPDRSTDPSAVTVREMTRTDLDLTGPGRTVTAERACVCFTEGHWTRKYVRRCEPTRAEKEKRMGKSRGLLGTAAQQTTHGSIRSWPARGVDAGRARERTPRNGQLIGGSTTDFDTSVPPHRVLRSLLCFETLGGVGRVLPRPRADRREPFRISTVAPCLCSG